MGKYLNCMVTFGTDIEYILSDEAGKYRAAIPFIEGSKSAPQLLTGGNVQKDNVAFEVAIDYSSNSSTILKNMGTVFYDAHKLIPEGWSLNAIPSALFPDSELDDPIAKEFGCDPDFDAKTGNTNVMDVSSVHPNFRSFGLHVHTGRRMLRGNRAQEMARYHILASDFVLGLFSTIVDNSKAALDRRKLYGKPSAYRMKPYGVEYRTLSNFWSQSPKLIELLINLNDYATCVARPGTLTAKVFNKYDIYNIARIIKDGDKIAAYHIWMNDVFPDLDEDDQQLVKAALQTDEYGTITEEWSEYLRPEPKLNVWADWGDEPIEAPEELFFETRTDYNGVRYALVHPLQRGVA